MFIPPTYYECTITMSIPGDAGPAQCVFGGLGATPGSASAVALAIEAEVIGQPDFRGMLPTVVSIEDITVRYNAGGLDPEVVSLPQSSAGTIADTPPPPQVATLLRKVTGFAGRQNRGRMYLPAISEVSILDTGLWNPVAFADLQSKADGFNQGLAAANVPMYVLHNDPADPPRQVASLEVSQKVATQRRRLR